MVNDNLFAVMGSKTIKLYSRPQLLYVPPVVPITATVSDGAASKPAKKKWMSKKDKAAAAAQQEAETTPDVSSAASLASTEAKHSMYNDFTLCGKINIFQGACNTQAPKEPTILRLLAKDKLLVGFDDGSAQVIFSPELVDPATLRAARPTGLQISLGEGRRGEGETKAAETEPAKGTMAAVLCEFQAHFVAERGYQDGETHRPRTGTLRLGTAETGDAKDDLSEPDVTAPKKATAGGAPGLRTALVCPWSSCSGAPGLGYQFEVLTVGSDRRIAHWGVRFKSGHTDVALEPHYSAITRASTAIDLTDEVSEDPLNQEDSTVQESVVHMPLGERLPSDIPMEADMLGVRKLLCVSMRER
jgi:hypothetical protein